MPFRAVLFDVGGPIDTEVLHEQGIDRDLVEAFAAAGRAVSPAELQAASDAAVASFAPDAYAAMTWQLSGQDQVLFDRAWTMFRAGEADRAARRGGVELRAGIDGLLLDLRGRGLKLGLAANQPSRVVASLEAHGLAGLFDYRQVSGHHGFRKPDARLFLHACEALEVAPAECVMVGDRIDNDIAPAKLLGMAAVLVSTGRHRNQQPRSPAELPDAEANDVPTLGAALETLLSRP